MPTCFTKRNSDVTVSVSLIFFKSNPALRPIDIRPSLGRCRKTYRALFHKSLEYSYLGLRNDYHS